MQMLVNRRDDDTVVTLANHSGKDWRGEIRMARAGKPKIEEVRDLVSDDAFPARLMGLGETEMAARVRIPAYGVRVIAFGKRRERQAELSFHRPITAKTCRTTTLSVTKGLTISCLAKGCLTAGCRMGR